MSKGQSQIKHTGIVFDISDRLLGTTSQTQSLFALRLGGLRYVPISQGKTSISLVHY
jgi:hypothetical protein